MLFLKEVLGEKYEEFKGIIDAYNSENKDKQVKLANPHHAQARSMAISVSASPFSPRLRPARRSAFSRMAAALSAPLIREPPQRRWMPDACRAQTDRRDSGPEWKCRQRAGSPEGRTA